MALTSTSIFFIDTDKINPNPYQPRREFDESALRDLSDSIRQYGVLQPLVISRIEVEREDGMGMETRYELIAGERRLRASRLAGIKQVPAVIREGDDNKMKLELAIIENLQREDLNAVDRARAFMRLIDEFSLTHAQVGQKMGKSREYVSNSLRILQMPQEILDALSMGKITEGHTRPLMMLVSRPEEQETLFKEIVYKKLSVRESERIARRIAVDRVRKKELLPDANVMSIEDDLEEKLGTRVRIERKADGGKITIDFFSDADLDEILFLLKSKELARNETMLERFEREKNITPPADLPGQINLQNQAPDQVIDENKNNSSKLLQNITNMIDQVVDHNPYTTPNVTANTIQNQDMNTNIVDTINTVDVIEDLSVDLNQDNIINPVLEVEKDLLLNIDNQDNINTVNAINTVNLPQLPQMQTNPVQNNNINEDDLDIYNISSFSL